MERAVTDERIALERDASFSAGVDDTVDQPGSVVQVHTVEAIHDAQISKLDVVGGVSAYPGVEGVTDGPVPDAGARPSRGNLDPLVTGGDGETIQVDGDIIGVDGDGRTERSVRLPVSR